MFNVGFEGGSGGEFFGDRDGWDGMGYCYELPWRQKVFVDGRLVCLDTYLRERVINEETSVYFKCLFVCCEFEPPWRRGWGEFYIHGMSLVVQIVTWV